MRHPSALFTATTRPSAVSGSCRGERLKLTCFAVAALNYEDGIWLEEQDEAGHKIEFIFDYNPADALGVEDGSVKMNEFSSWGSTLDGRMKPEISAPGMFLVFSPFARSF
jgi:hypothetical protein